MSKKKWDWRKEPPLEVGEANAILARAVRGDDKGKKALRTFYELEKLLGGASLHLHANVNAEQLLPAAELRALAVKAKQLPPGFGHPRSDGSEDEPIAVALTNEEDPPDDEDEDPAE